MSSTPYDDACKTMIYECPELLVPIVNRAFRTKWPRDARVVVEANEFLKRDGVDEMSARYLDGLVSIEGHIYHVEIQTDADGSIALRIVEYDFLVATRSIRIEDGVVKARFPRSVLIGLRRGAIRREPYMVELELPDGTTHSCAIPTLSIQDITNDEIFDEDLYFLLPFIMFRHERDFEKIAADSERLAAIEAEIDDVRKKIIARAESGQIDTKTAGTVLELLDYVSRNLIKDHPKITERVIEMRGKVLELPFLKKWHEAEARGRQEGILLGEQRGVLLGEQRGIRQGMQQGRQEGGLNMLFGLVRGGHLKADIASAQAGLSLAAFNAKMAEYEAQTRAQI